jgi:hypothetical protein
MNKIINEHEMTKMMINVMSKRIIREQDEKPEDDKSKTGDVITPSENDSTYTDELKKISDTVDPRIQITNFNIYPKDRNVELDGRLDLGVNFFMSIKEMKLSISITDEQGRPIKIYLDNDLLGIIQKLNGYYTNWTKEWAQKLNTEYKQK